MSYKIPKVRKRDFTADVHENFSDGVDFDNLESNKKPNIKFNNQEEDIELDRSIIYTFTPGDCDLDAVATDLLMSSDYWHLVTVHHQGAFSKEEIQRGIDEIVNDIIFIPVVYQTGKKEDTFYIHNHSIALKNMLDHNLQINDVQRRLNFTLTLAVANFKKGQIDPVENLEAAIDDCIDKFREQRLDFSYFSKHRYLVDVVFSMGNKECFEMFCDLLYHNLTQSKTLVVAMNLKILVLVGNNIKSLNPLTKFATFQSLENLSLKHNFIETIEDFQALKPLRLKMMNVAGNPFLRRYDNHADQILDLLDTIERLDIKRSKPLDTPDVQPDRSGYVDKPSHSEKKNLDVRANTSKVLHPEPAEKKEIVRVKFSNNENDIELDKKINHVFTPGNNNPNAIATSLMMSPEYWHSITIHHQGAFVIEEIERGLLEIANDVLFIPIGYHSGKNEDTFYVHNQGAALHNLLKKNLQIVITNRRLTFTLKLVVADYKTGQINPVENLDAAIVDVMEKLRENRLDFSYFHKHRFLVDMMFSMKNNECFQLFCDNLLRNLFRDKYRNVVNNTNILVLVGNNIKYLEPLSKFIRCRHIENISLKNNSIETFDDLLALKQLKLKMLSIAGNPVTKNEKAADTIIEMLDTLEKLDIKKLKPAVIHELQEIEVESISLTEEVIRSEEVDDKMKRNFSKKEYVKLHWSEVFIEHQGRFDGKEVLDEMFNVFFEDFNCYPCYFIHGEYEDSFKLFNNFDAMNILVQKNLKMKMPNTNEEVTFRLHLKIHQSNSLTLRWSELLSKIIDKRISGQKLNMRNFHNDPELRDVIINMTSTEIKRYLMYLAVNKNLKIIDIDLSQNNLKSLKGFELLRNFPELISLDFSQNKIATLDWFPYKLKIIELSMHKNPICDKYKTNSATPYDYLKTLSSLCPQLQYIDGRKIDQDFKIIHLYNYFASAIAYPAIESFINFFFKYFDVHESRMNLLCDALYRSDTMLTTVQKTVKTDPIVGVENIREYYRNFPFTEHDFITMTVDTPLFNNRSILVVVNGVFKQKDFSSINKNDKLFTFSRTFLLRKDLKGNRRNGRVFGTLSQTYNFEIQNEIFAFDSLTDSKIKNKAFRKHQAVVSDVESALDGAYSLKNESLANLELFRQMTLLSDEWCKRFMEDAAGNIGNALKTFFDFFKIGMLKKEDFKVN